jgi:hypothetical protein
MMYRSNTASSFGGASVGSAMPSGGGGAAPTHPVRGGMRGASGGPGPGPGSGSLGGPPAKPPQASHKPPPPPPPPSGGGGGLAQRGDHGDFWQPFGMEGSYQGQARGMDRRGMMSASGSPDIRGDHRAPPPPPPDSHGPLGGQLRRGSADSYGSGVGGPIRSHSPASPHPPTHHRDRDRDGPAWMDPKWDHRAGPGRPQHHPLAKQAYAGGYHSGGGGGGGGGGPMRPNPERPPLHNDRMPHNDRPPHRQFDPGQHNDSHSGFTPGRRPIGRR